METTPKRIWQREVSIEEYNREFYGNSLGSHLGIAFTELGPNYLLGTMPVDERTKQPYGLLHGGASAAFAESLGSVAGYLCVDPAKYRVVGLEINCNHIRAVRDGMVHGRCDALHVGQRTQVWQITITTPEGKLVCVSRLTIAVVEIEAIAR